MREYKVDNLQGSQETEFVNKPTKLGTSTFGEGRTSITSDTAKRDTPGSGTENQQVLHTSTSGNRLAMN